MAVSAHCKPEMAFLVTAYISILLNLAWDIRGQDWLHYNRLLCQAATVNTSLPRHRCEPDIWLIAIPSTGGNLLPSARLPSQSCQPPAVRAVPPSTQSDICWRQNQGKCNFSRCRYHHVCFVCESEHLTRSFPILTLPTRQKEQ